MKKNVYGEGNYEASRDYNSRTKKFVASGRVDAAAKAAAPSSPGEAQDMKNAEEAALLRGKGDDSVADQPDAASTVRSQRKKSAVPVQKRR